jgi:ABC-type transporter Mla MlaB component
MIMVPAAGQRNSTMEMISISSVDLSDAQRIDASAPHE